MKKKVAVLCLVLSSVVMMYSTSLAGGITVSGDTVENTSEGGQAKLVQRAVGAGGLPLIHGEAADGTLASPEATPSGRTLLSVGGAGYTGSAWTSGSSTIRFRSTELWSDTGQGSEITFSTTPNGSAPPLGRTERMRITNDGRVGIGTNTPSEALDVAGNVKASGGFSGSGSGLINLDPTHITSGTAGINISGNAASVTNGVYSTGSYADPSWITSLDGAKISGTVANATTVTNGIYSTGSYADPSWMTSLAGAKISGTVANASDSDTLEGQHASDIINAASDEVRAPISSLPYTINSSGSYYLTDNLTSTGNGINVNADNVTINFNGFTITGPGKSSATGYGVYMNGRKNVEIKNGTVREFGYDGIREASSAGRGHRIIHMRVEDNGAPSTYYYGIILYGKHHLVRDCTVNSNSWGGIITAGEGPTVTGNTAGDNGGIGIITGIGATVTGNNAYNNASDGIKTGGWSTVKNNTSCHNGHYGFNFYGNSVVDGNCAYGNDTAGGYTNMSGCTSCAFGTNVGQP